MVDVDAVVDELRVDHRRIREAVGGDIHAATVPWRSWAYALVFVVSGISVAASNIARNGHLLDLAPAAQRPLYLGFTNTLRGLAQFAALASGLIVDWAGFAVLMILSACFYGLAMACSLVMSEPRASGLLVNKIQI